MSTAPKNSAASHRQIFDRLICYAGRNAPAELEEVTDLLEAGQSEQAHKVLAELDKQIGGYGIHTRLDADAAGWRPYNSSDRSVYRPIDYVIMHLSHPQAEWYARDVAEMACVHVEGTIKRFVEQRNLLERFRRSPLGSLLHKRRVRNALPPTVWEDLCWLNRRVYVHAKHEFGWREDSDEEEGERDGHLFTVEEALAIYLIARHLVVQVVEISNNAQ